MIVYLDASALVKRYVAEVGSADLRRLLSRADVVGTVLVTRVEIAAALGKAVRVNALTTEKAAAALRLARADWADLLRLPVTEALVSRAEVLAWEHQLRGYDAVHLAAAVLWHEMIDSPITVATFDRQLWTASAAQGLSAWPENLDRLAE